MNAKDNNERILKAAREKQLFIYKGYSVRLTANFTLESWRLEGGGMTYLKCWGKKIGVNKKFCIWQNHFSKMKEKLWHSEIQKKKLRKFVANRFTVKGIIEGPSDKMEKEMATTPVNLPGEFHAQRKLAGYSPWGCSQAWLSNYHSDKRVIRQ